MKTNYPKTLTVAIGVVAFVAFFSVFASLTRAKAADRMDTGVALILVFTTICSDPGVTIPASTQQEADAHISIHYDEVMAEAKRIMNGIANTPGMTKDTAARAWCGVMRGKIERQKAESYR